jgi:hypothetical protein
MGQENPHFTIKLCDKKENGYGLFSNVEFKEEDVILENVGTLTNDFEVVSET